jgi:hypothetical protein
MKVQTKFKNEDYQPTKSSHIYKTKSGKYRFRASVNKVRYSKTFEKLTEAREYKEKILKTA